MAGKDKNIIVGAAQFYVGTGDAALPTLTAAKPVSATENQTVLTTAGFADVGFTQEGVEVSYEPDYGDVEVDQLLDSARVFKQSMRVTVNTTLAEATLENLLIVWGQDGDTLTGGTGTTDKDLDIEAGELGDAPLERSLLFVGPAPRTYSVPRERVYHVRRGIQTESSSHALRRSEVTALPVSFRVLPFTDANGKSSYGTVKDRAKSA